MLPAVSRELLPQRTLPFFAAAEHREFTALRYPPFSNPMLPIW